MKIPRVLPILMYHQIMPESATAYSEHIAVTPEIFQQQMQQLVDEAWKFFRVDQWEEAFSYPGKAVIVSFDDITQHFITYAQPIMDKLNISASVFPIQNMTQSKEVKNISHNGITALSEDDLRQIQASGYEIGSHCQSHSNLNHLSYSDAVAELKESKLWLEQVLGKPIKSVCYPIGGVNKDLIAAAKELGYQYGLTTLKSCLQWPDDHMVLRRVVMKNDVLGRKLQSHTNFSYGLRRFLSRPFRSKYRIDYGHPVT